MVALKQNSKYSIEYRIFKNTHWYSGYFRNMKSEWSGWLKLENFDDLAELSKEHAKLEAKRPYLKYTTEYRVVKLDPITINTTNTELYD